MRCERCGVLIKLRMVGSPPDRFGQGGSAELLAETFAFSLPPHHARRLLSSEVEVAQADVAPGG